MRRTPGLAGLDGGGQVTGRGGRHPSRITESRQLGRPARTRETHFAEVGIGSEVPQKPGGCSLQLSPPLPCPPDDAFEALRIEPFSSPPELPCPM